MEKEVFSVGCYPVVCSAKLQFKTVAAVAKFRGELDANNMKFSMQTKLAGRAESFIRAVPDIDPATRQVGGVLSPGWKEVHAFAKVKARISRPRW
eukprot:6883751-Lingulodinium_polyedra.AAC.1